MYKTRQHVEEQKFIKLYDYVRSMENEMREISELLQTRELSLNSCEGCRSDSFVLERFEVQRRASLR